MTTILPRVNLWDEETGYPTPGLNTTKFSLSFSKLPNLQLFANAINLPSITLGSANQSTPFLDMKQVGEKLVYSSFTVSFILDSKMDGYREIYKWMYDLSVQGLNTDTISNCTLLFDSGEIEFLEVFPTSLGQLTFDSKATDIAYASIDVTFECDRYIFK
jgi:hypothetical protein